MYIMSENLQWNFSRILPTVLKKLFPNLSWSCAGKYMSLLKFSIKEYFSKFDQIRGFLRIWSHLLKKNLNGKLRFLCAESALKNKSSNSFNNFKWDTKIITKPDFHSYKRSS